MIASILIGLGISLVVAWSAFAACVFAVRPAGQTLTEPLRVFRDSVRLAGALYRDPTLPSGVRWRLRIALIYNLQPINLIPDFVPVIGFADNVGVLAWALRSTVRAAGVDAVDRHWRGSSESLATLYRALRLSARTPRACVARSGEPE